MNLTLLCGLLLTVACLVLLGLTLAGNTGCLVPGIFSGIFAYATFRVELARRKAEQHVDDMIHGRRRRR